MDFGGQQNQMSKQKHPPHKFNGYFPYYLSCRRNDVYIDQYKKMQNFLAYYYLIDLSFIYLA